MPIVTRDKHGNYTKKRQQGDGLPLDKKTATHQAVINGGKTWSKRFKTRQEAVNEERRMLNAQDDGAEIGKDKITLATFIDEVWLPRKRLRVESDRLDKNTLGAYELQIDLHIRGTKLGKKTLRDIHDTTLQKFYVERKRTRGWTGVKSMQNLHALISNILQLAVEKGYLTKNPAAADGVRPADKSRQEAEESAREAEAFDPDEVKKILIVALPHRLYAAWRLMLVAGLRRGEVLGLEWKDVDFNKNVIHLRRTWKTEVKPRKHVIGAIKTGRPRTVKLDQVTMDELRAHKKRQNEERLHAGNCWSNPEGRTPVFTDELGAHIVPQTFSRTFKRLLAQAGIRDGFVQELRHTAVTHAAKNKMDVAAAAERFGHSVAVMHNIYTHVTREAADEGADIAASIADVG
jgi:integrase